MSDAVDGSAKGEVLRFEMGPIRPPNEASSLLVRVTRNCPWNRCTFCPVYKGERFGLRKAEEVKADIRAMATLAARLRELSWRLGWGGEVKTAIYQALRPEERSPGVAQVARFLNAGGATAFLQDANSLIMPVDALLDVLETLRAAFPTVIRVTTYARAHTVRKRSVEDLARLRAAGLDRIHVGLESGSDRVLAAVEKGVTSAQHVEAGLRVKEAGIELSSYVMPGLGGRSLSEEHATQTARVLGAIDPHFVRLRTLAVPPGSPLAEKQERGEFDPLGDVEIVREIRSMLAALPSERMTSTVCSDHILNLLEEIEGRLPHDLPRMLGAIDRLLAMDEAEREIFLVGRRLGFLRTLGHMDDPAARSRAERALGALRERFPGPVEAALREVASRFL